jgi:hypothetical protein
MSKALSGVVSFMTDPPSRARETSRSPKLFHACRYDRRPSSRHRQSSPRARQESVSDILKEVIGDPSRRIRRTTQDTTLVKSPRWSHGISARERSAHAAANPRLFATVGCRCSRTETRATCNITAQPQNVEAISKRGEAQQLSCLVISGHRRPLSRRGLRSNTGEVERRSTFPKDVFVDMIRLLIDGQVGRSANWLIWLASPNRLRTGVIAVREFKIERRGNREVKSMVVVTGRGVRQQLDLSGYVCRPVSC